MMELVIAIAVILTFLVGAIALISYSVSSIRGGKSKIIAMGLVQEGLEIVRNIRDSNWLAGYRLATDWTANLTPGNHRVQYDSRELLPPASSQPLKLDPATGFYQYNNGDNTIFFRNINIEYIDNTQIRVTSEVTWQENGQSNSVNAETRLYNWLEP